MILSTTATHALTEAPTHAVGFQLQLPRVHVVVSLCLLVNSVLLSPTATPVRVLLGSVFGEDVFLQSVTLEKVRECEVQLAGNIQPQTLLLGLAFFIL